MARATRHQRKRRDEKEFPRALSPGALSVPPGGVCDRSFHGGEEPGHLESSARLDAKEALSCRDRHPNKAPRSSHGRPGRGLGQGLRPIRAGSLLWLGRSRCHSHAAIQPGPVFAVWNLSVRSRRGLVCERGGPQGDLWSEWKEVAQALLGSRGHDRDHGTQAFDRPGTSEPRSRSQSAVPAKTPEVLQCACSHLCESVDIQQVI